LPKKFFAALVECGAATVLQVLEQCLHYVNKELAVDLLRISDPHRISEPGQPGDVGIGRNFAFPFQTIEDILFFDRKHIGVLNDNNFPFSVGRHVGSGQPDDEEFIVIKLDRPL
jgi:glycerophosphoryl diester phosphodiesterase